MLQGQCVDQDIMKTVHEEELIYVVQNYVRILGIEGDIFRTLKT